MIFDRYLGVQHDPAGLSLPRLRLLTAVALIAYPAGALMVRFWPEPETVAWLPAMIGFGLILLAFAAAAVVVCPGSSASFPTRRNCWTR